MHRLNRLIYNGILYAPENAIPTLRNAIPI